MLSRGLTGLFFVLALRWLAPPTAPDALVVLAGDQHSAYERTAQVVAAVDGLKAEHPGLPIVILLDGDTLENGNVVARRSRGIVDFAMLSALAKRAPTVVNLGNHETEFDGLAETVARIEATGAQVVTNLTNRTTGRPAAPPAVPLTLGAYKAIVIGVATDDVSTYREAVRPSLGVTDPVSWARVNFPALLATAPVKVVLSHAGLTADRGMLPLVPDGTLFAGAHDHLRFLQPFGRTVYVHSGSWNAFLTLAWLRHDTSGVPRWDVEQIPVPSKPADPDLTALIRQTQARYLAPEDRAVVAHLPAALAPADAARAVAGALRRGAGADAAFIGNTTFGGGLPAGDVTRAAFDACVRFDGEIFVAAIDGARLRRLLTAANQGAETAFERRSGEFNVASGPAAVDDAKVYRVVTTDWGAKHSARYFGEPAIAWHEQAHATLKAIVLREFYRPAHSKTTSTGR
jgi:2',3'-cyclic-nucleotide 2'-phosphodiesterase (5'-nucleotidase family)